MKTGVIFDIKRYAIHDGPGIRTTVFFKGCPLLCGWCHNPEGLDSRPQLVFIENRCLEGCSECVKACADEALLRAGQNVFIDREKCSLCGDCVQTCPSEALEMIGNEVSAEEVMKEIEKDRIFHEESSGGVTFSGGEPLWQPDFLNALLEECKKVGCHTCLDTSGYASSEVLDLVADKVDLFLYDIKLLDDAAHRKFTGVSNKLILENIKKLSEKGQRIVVRIPIIQGVNDSDENITQTAGFLRSLGGIKEISLLPYHRIGSQKYRRLNMGHMVDKVHPPSKSKIEKMKKKLEHSGFRVKTGD